MATLLDGPHARPQRKTRSDKGVRRPHPPHCRHCTECVEQYRHIRAVEEQAIGNGGWRDETWPSRIITFRKWLQHWRYEPVDGYGDEPAA